MRITILIFALFLGCAKTIPAPQTKPAESPAPAIEKPAPVTAAPAAPIVPVQPMAQKIEAPKTQVAVPETALTVIVDFDTVYKTAPAVQRLRGNLDDYGPAREYDSLLNDTSSANASRKALLKIKVASKMNSIVYECKNLIYKTIQKNWPATRIICDTKGKILVSNDLKNSKTAVVHLSQIDITRDLIEALK
jgi:hypothetical protein